MRKAVQIRPQEGHGRRPVTLRVRVAVTAPASAQITLADVLLQAGSISTGWVPHTTEMPWTAGVVGG